MDPQNRPKRCRDVMRFLRKNGIRGVGLLKGPGYFCFDGAPTVGWRDHTVRVCFLADLTYGEWLAEYTRLELQAKDQSGMRSGCSPLPNGRTCGNQNATINEPEGTEQAHYSAQESAAMFKMLDAISDQTLPWQETKARKEHIDLFGEVIRPGEYYFKRSTGPGFLEVVKLSQASMDRMLYALFAGNLRLQRLAEYLMRERFNKMREALKAFSPPLPD